MKKIVIIGAGEIGKQALAFLGAEFVAYFADNKKAGSTYCEKQVYPVEKAAEEKEQYVLLLAITKYRMELTKQLNELGVHDFYYFDDDIYFGNIFQGCNFPMTERASFYDCIKDVQPDTVCIYGDRRKIGSFVAEVMEIDHCVTESSEEGIGQLERLAKKYSYILINAENYTEELMEKLNTLKANVWFVVKYYSTNYYQKNRLGQYKGIHKGKRCFIIGNGPSLRMEDLDVLAKQREICFGLNLIHMAYPNTRWRPDYICVSDILTIKKNAEKIIKNNKCPLFIADSFLRLYGDELVDRRIMPFCKLYSDEIKQYEYGFSRDIEQGICNANSVAYYALQIAAYMGFEEIYLLGMDNGNWALHFDGEYLEEADVLRQNFDWMMESRIILQAFQKAEELSKEYGYKVYNATRGGYLEVHERVDFDKLFGV